MPTTSSKSDIEDALRLALETAVADPEMRDGFRLVAGCVGGSDWRSMEAFETGVAVWGGERQFQLMEAEVTDLLKQLLGADFPSLPDSYGGTLEPDRMQTNNARMVVCSLSVAIAGLDKTVLQVNRGEQSESFAELVNGLLDSCEKRAAEGISAQSLEEGLEKVASGELDPVTFELHYQQIAEGATSPQAGTEFILGVQGLIATTRTRDGVDGYSEPSRLEMRPPELSELAWSLAARDPGRFRQNLWAPSYTDLSLRVLNRKMSLVARPYSGVDQETHGELQRDFDATIDLLESLHERVLNEGSQTPAEP